jgi:uncharacterized RmlC-like cupin family protein
MSDKKPDTAGVVVVKGSDVKAESGYEATMPHGFGIGTQTGSKTLNVHTAYLEPGQATRAHFHLYSDGACYVLEGEILLVTYNENYEKLEQEVRAGDFIYIPRGVIHKFINRSETKRFANIGIYNDGVYADDGTPLHKYYVEPPLD